MYLRTVSVWAIKSNRSLKIPIFHKTSSSIPLFSKGNFGRSHRIYIAAIAATAIGVNYMSTRAHAEEKESKIPTSIFDFEAIDIDGNPVSLSNYKGKVCLVVNVASKWGATKVTYKELQSLYEKYHSSGFEVLAFPSNDFGHQEPGTEAEIKSFVKREFGVTFPLFAKINVNGDKTHPLWVFLKEYKAGLLGTTFIKWNFTKFLCDRNGLPVERFGTNSSPSSFEDQIIALLNGKEKE